MQYGESNPDPARWRIMMEEVAEANWGLLSRHRWLLDADTTRPPPGPGTIDKYDAELRALTDTGLDDVDIDLASDCSSSTSPQAPGKHSPPRP